MTTTNRFIQPLELVKVVKRLGGPGSGNFGHAGRPGQVGGSAPDLESIGAAADVSTAPMPIGALDVKVYRVGPVDEPEIYFGGTHEDTAPYAMLHEGHEVKPYSVKTENTLAAKNHFQLYTSLYPGKRMQDAVYKVDQAQIKKDGKGDSKAAWQKVQRKMMREVVKRGYDSVLFTAPPAPAKTELVIVNKKSATFRALGGPGSGNFGHAGRPGKVGGSAPENPLEGEAEGVHTPEAQQRLIAYLERETGLKLKAHGSTSRGETSQNDFDIIVVPEPQGSEEEWNRQNEESTKLFERVDRGELTYDEAMEMIYGDAPDPVEAALTKIGFKATREMGFGNIYVTRYHNAATRHTIELWSQNDDDGDAESGPAGWFARDLGGPGSGNFGHAGRPGLVGGSGPGIDIVRNTTWYHGSTATDLTKFTNDRIRGDDLDAAYTGVWLSESENTSPAMVNPKALYVVEPIQVRRIITRPDASKFAWNLEKDPDYAAKFKESGAKGAGDYARMMLLKEGYDVVLHEDKPDINTEELERTGETSFKLDWRNAVMKKEPVYDDAPDGPMSYNLYVGGQYITGYESAQDLIDQTERVIVILDADNARIKEQRPSPWLRGLGGPGSGNFGHAGRPGQVGGSAPDEGYVDDGGSSWSPMSNTVLKEMLALHKERSPSVQTLLKELKRRAKKGDARAQQVHDETVARLKAPTYGAPKASEDPAPGSDYYYHSAPADAVPSILASGLTAKDTNPVSLSPHLESVETWKGLLGHKTPVLFRMSREDVREILPDDYDPEDKGAELHTKGVKPGALEIYQDGEWKRLKNFRAAKAPTLAKRVNFNKVNQRAAAWAKKYAAEMITDVTETSRKRIKQAIVNLLEGTDYKTVLEQISKAVGDDDRAELIARHETMSAVSAGQREAWAQAVEDGVIPKSMKRVWITTPINPCPICEALEGRTARIGGVYPDGSPGPPRHVKCRCTEGLQ